MNFQIPIPLQQEHEALHERLRLATQAGGDVGEPARTVARLMHPHFVKEDSIALPPLGLLAALARGEVTPEMTQVLVLTDQLEAGLPAMLAEHRSIVQALGVLSDAARSAGRNARRAARWTWLLSSGRACPSRRRPGANRGAAGAPCGISPPAAWPGPQHWAPVPTWACFW